MKKSIISCVAFIGFFMSSPALALTGLGPVKKDVKALNSAGFVCAKAAKGEYVTKSDGTVDTAAPSWDAFKSRAASARSRR